MFSQFQVNMASSSSRRNNGPSYSARTPAAPGPSGSVMNLISGITGSNATAGASSSAASRTAASSSVPVDPLYNIKTALASQDMNQILSVGDYNIWERDVQKTTGLERKDRFNVVKKVNKLLLAALKSYGVKCRDRETIDRLLAGLSSAVEMGIVVRLQSNATSLDPNSQYHKPMIKKIYLTFMSNIEKEFKSLEMGQNGPGVKPPHADEFIAIVTVWKDKAHERSDAPLFAPPSNAALPRSSPALAPTPAPAPTTSAPPARALLAPANASVPLPRNTPQGPSAIKMVPLANTNTGGTLAGLGASAHATAGNTSMEVDSAPQGSINPMGIIPQGTAPQAPPAPAGNSDEGDEMEYEITLSSSNDFASQAGPAPPTAPQISSGLPLRRSPSPDIVDIPEDMRQQGMQYILAEVALRNAEAAAYYKEHLTPAEIPECAQLMEHNVLTAMANDIRISTGEFKQEEIETQYCILLNRKVDDCTILAKFIKKVKQFHQHVRNGLAKVRGYVQKKYHGFTSPCPSPSPPTPPPAPTPSMGPLRDDFKQALHKTVMETGQQVLSNEHLPQLHLTKDDVDDLVNKLEAEMFGNLDEKYGHMQPSLDESCQKYVAEGKTWLEKIRDHDLFKRTVAKYKGLI